MTGYPLLSSPLCFLEIGPDALRALKGEKLLELNLERQPNGRLAEGCKERVRDSLRAFFKRKPWQLPSRAICAIGARGVTLRRLWLPASADGSVEQLLRLQIETEFPLPPEELAWGYRRISPTRPVPPSAKGKQPFLVLAVRRQVIDEYSELLASSGVSPVFTLAALARNSLCLHPPADYAILDLGQTDAELIAFEDGEPSAVRVLAWGGAGTGTSAPLARLINGHGVGEKVYLSGGRVAELSAPIADRLGIHCELLEPSRDQPISAALLGLQRMTQQEGQGPLLFEAGTGSKRAAGGRPASVRWAALAFALALTFVCLPYLEAIVAKPRLARKLTALKADRGRLETIERELTFLQFLKQNQPPYLDAMDLMAGAAPPGARIESLTLNRRGQISLRGTLQNSQQVADFRSKLIDSGFFSAVGVDEQTPTQDRQKLTVRMTAQWKPTDSRPPVKLQPARNSGRPLPSGAPERLPPASSPGPPVPTAASAQTKK